MDRVGPPTGGTADGPIDPRHCGDTAAANLFVDHRCDNMLPPPSAQ